MALFNKKYNAPGNNEKMVVFSTRPEGSRVFTIISSKNVANKGGTGTFLQLNCRITQGKYSNQMAVTRLNLDHPNPVAVEMSEKTLNSICDAVRVVGATESEQLHGIEFIGTESCKWNSVYGFGNDFIAFNKFEGVVPEDTAEMPAPPPPAGGIATVPQPIAQAVPQSVPNPQTVAVPVQQVPVQPVPVQQPPVYQQVPVQQVPVYQQTPQQVAQPVPVDQPAIPVPVPVPPEAAQAAQGVVPPANPQHTGDPNPVAAADAAAQNQVNPPAPPAKMPWEK